MVYLAIAVLIVALMMVLILAALYAHGSREARMEMDLDAQWRAEEAAHRARVYGDPKENA